MYFTAIQRVMYIILHLVLHLFKFICSQIKVLFFLQILDLLNCALLIFFRVTFATKLSTNVVYISIFVIDYN